MTTIQKQLIQTYTNHFCCPRWKHALIVKWNQSTQGKPMATTSLNNMGASCMSSRAIWVKGLAQWHKQPPSCFSYTRSQCQTFHSYTLIDIDQQLLVLCRLSIYIDNQFSIWFKSITCRSYNRLFEWPSCYPYLFISVLKVSKVVIFCHYSNIQISDIVFW